VWELALDRKGLIGFSREGGGGTRHQHGSWALAAADGLHTRAILYVCTGSRPKIEGAEESWGGSTWEEAKRKQCSSCHTKMFVSRM
jgi:hypothetical protein